MEFINASLDRSDEYRDFIQSHENAVKTEKAAWIAAAKAGKKVIAYSESFPEDEPDRDPLVYFEFADEDKNLYVDFFNRDTKQWVESFKFFDEELAWTIGVDNMLYGYPLGGKAKEENA